MTARKRKVSDESPVAALEALANEALQVAKKARVHRKSLAGDNFYGNKLADLRTNAANVFRELTSRSAGDTTALAELIDALFSANTAPKARLEAFRELSFALGTTWKQAKSKEGGADDESFFPLAILTQAKRGYLVSVGRQMNGCFAEGWYDACAVMMRRLIEVAIIEAFEHKQLAARITDKSGNYLHLSDLITEATAQPALTLSRNVKKHLPHLRDIGHMSAHGRYYHARKEDIEKVQLGCRVVVEEFLHHAGLL